jgi:ubiquinone/menaquinone biosynthesis C-methylase UbiE
MYKELRATTSTPSMWSTTFLAQPTLPARVAGKLRVLDTRWKAIRQALKRGERVLDAGCGMGDWVEFLRQRGYTATGLDYSETLVERLRRVRPETEWIQGEIQRIPLPDGELDGVISWGVIEHDESGPGSALREFHRVLRPGGWIFVTVPIDTPSQRASSEVQFADERATGRFFQYFFTEAELASVVSEAGFQVSSVTPCGYHYALALPRTYVRLSRAPAAVQAVTTRALNVWARTRKDTFNMALAVAQKPGGVAPRDERSHV